MICAARRLTDRRRAERKMIGKIDPKRTSAGSRGWSNSIRATDPLIRIIVLSGHHGAACNASPGHAVWPGLQPKVRSIRGGNHAHRFDLAFSRSDRRVGLCKCAPVGGLPLPVNVALLHCINGSQLYLYPAGAEA
jgi:hypothetical protein